jgi:hypothetical protein
MASFSRLLRLHSSSNYSSCVWAVALHISSNYCTLTAHLKRGPSTSTCSHRQGAVMVGR